MQSQKETSLSTAAKQPSSSSVTSTAAAGSSPESKVTSDEIKEDNVTEKNSILANYSIRV